MKGEGMDCSVSSGWRGAQLIAKDGTVMGAALDSVRLSDAGIILTYRIATVPRRADLVEVVTGAGTGRWGHRRPIAARVYPGDTFVMDLTMTIRDIDYGEATVDVSCSA